MSESDSRHTGVYEICSYFLVSGLFYKSVHSCAGRDVWCDITMIRWHIN